MSNLLRDLIPAFRRDLRIIGRSEMTVQTYDESIRRYVQWLETKNGAEGTVRGPCVEDITQSSIKEYLAHLRALGRSPNTISRARSSLAAFCSWLVEEELVARNPIQGVKTIKTVSSPVRIVEDGDLIGLLRATQGKTFFDRRDHAIIRVLAETGVRRSELLGMHLDDIDLDEQTAYIRRGKGGRSRYVYLGHKTSKALDRYLRVRGQQRYAYLDELWIGKRGALGWSGLKELLRKRCYQAGIEHIHPHRFRHTFAHLFLAEGGDPESLRRLAGWSSYSMLQVYGASAADQRASKVARRLHLGNRW